MVALGSRFELTPIDRTVDEHLADTDAAVSFVPALTADRTRRVGLTALLGSNPVRTVWKNRRMALLEAGRLEEADLATIEYDAAGQEVQTPRHRAGNRQWTAVRELLRGDFDAAERIGAEAPALQPNAPEFALGYYTQLFAIRKEQGRLHELRGATDLRIESMAPVSAGALAAEIEASTGHHDRATALVASLLPRLGDLARNWQWLPTLALLADACALTGFEPGAPPILSLLESQVDRVIVLDGSTLCWGSVARFTAPLHELVGDDDTAEQRHRQALAVHDRMGAVPFRVPRPARPGAAAPPPGPRRRRGRGARRGRGGRRPTHRPARGAAGLRRRRRRRRSADARRREVSRRRSSPSGRARR